VTQYRAQESAQRDRQAARPMLSCRDVYLARNIHRLDNRRIHPRTMACRCILLHIGVVQRHRCARRAVDWSQARQLTLTLSGGQAPTPRGVGARRRGEASGGPQNCPEVGGSADKTPPKCDATKPLHTGPYTSTSASTPSAAKTAAAIMNQTLASRCRITPARTPVAEIESSPRPARQNTSATDFFWCCRSGLN
jgi:hypothetical protein